jgi:hypothetical protein
MGKKYLEGDENSFPFSMLTSSSAEDEGIRWDPCCMVPYGKRAEEILPEVMETLAVGLKTHGHPITWNSHESILIIDNLRVLHARPAIVDSSERRELQRILVKGSNNAQE